MEDGGWRVGKCPFVDPTNRKEQKYGTGMYGMV